MQLIMGNNGGTIVLDDDYEESIKILSTYSITIDLAGHTISNSDTDYTITNMGALTLMDSEGGGKVVNTAASKGCLVNLYGGIVNIEDGVEFSFGETARTSETAWFYVVNMGDLMKIDNAKVTAVSPNFAGIRNGYYDEDNDNLTNPVMVINGGTYSGIIPVKNDSYGTLTINGGTFSSASDECVLAWNKCLITGGTFTASDNYTIFSGAHENAGCDGGLNITGGTFNGDDGIINDLTETYAPEKIYSAVILVSGGSFNKTIPSQYIPSGYELTLSDGMYTFNKVGWDVSEFTPGGGFMNMKRCVLHAPKLNYTSGGFSIPATGFTPLAIMGCNAVGGVTAYYNPSTKKIVLYKGGSEATGAITDLTVVLIGY